MLCWLEKLGRVPLAILQDIFQSNQRDSAVQNPNQHNLSISKHGKPFLPIVTVVFCNLSPSSVGIRIAKICFQMWDFRVPHGNTRLSTPLIDLDTLRVKYQGVWILALALYVCSALQTVDANLLN